MATKKAVKLAKKVLENPSMEVTSADMQEVGYSPNTRPHEVMQTKGWLELMETYLPDEKLAQVHSEGLEALKIHGTDDNFIEVPDHPTRLKALDLAYKLKGKLRENNILIKNEGEMTLEFE